MNLRTKRYLQVSILIMLSIIIGVFSQNNIGYDKNYSLLVVAALIFTILIFNSIARFQHGFKNYFTHKLNFLTSKYKSEFKSNIQKDLMFYKIIEVLEKSDLRIKDIDAKNYKIFAISRLSGWSWGENIYLDFEESKQNTIMNFCSTSVFGLPLWGTNKAHMETLLQQFDDALII